MGTISRQEKARSKAALVAAKRLHAAADAVALFSLACLDCNDESSPRRADDGRTLLGASMREYAGWLDAVYGDGGVAA